MRNLLKLAMAGLALACADATEPTMPNGAWSAANTWAGEIVITDDADSPRWPSDPVTIHSAVVIGDSLELSVSFGGGCREHAFALLSSTAWMESYPVQVAIRLSHDANDDNCDALLSRLLRFNLRPLRAAFERSYHTTTGIIRLRIAGTDAGPLYSW